MDGDRNAWKLFMDALCSTRRKGTDDDDDDDDENSRLKYFIHFTNSHARYSP